MRSSALKLLQTFLILVLAAALAVPANLCADDHVVSTSDIRKALLAHGLERQKNLNRVQVFFNSDQASRALARFPAVRGQIEQTVAQLDDQELARLAVRVDKVQRDFAAGALTNQQLTYIIIALATAVLVLIIVEH